MKNIDTSGRDILMENALIQKRYINETEVPCALIELAKNHPEVTTISLVCYCPRCTTTC